MRGRVRVRYSGHTPTRWRTFDTAYGSKQELAAAIGALAPVVAIADVVVNHRCGVATAGADIDGPPFPTAQQTDAICSDDECHVGTGEPDTGENQIAARDLDHTSAGVQSAIVDYLDDLGRLGFRGWRYDEARGYAGAFVKIYNDASAPYLSVGAGPTSRPRSRRSSASARARACTARASSTSSRPTTASTRRTSTAGWP